MKKRRWALALAAAGLAGAGLGWYAWPRGGLFNPCRAGLPTALADDPRVRSAWEGLDPAACWDAHAHLLGTGDSGTGIYLNPRMDSVFSPAELVQRLVILNAGCVREDDGADRSYVERLRALVDGMHPTRAGRAKVLLFAFDCFVEPDGAVSWEKTSFHVPDAYAAAAAKRHAEQFEWVCSVHPYRFDCVERLEWAAANGARAVKWLPASMGIDPASARCDRAYAAMVRLGLPLITHAGLERAVQGSAAQQLGNPLKLRRPLELGVRTVVAHCASLGEDADTDVPSGRSVPSFSLFERLMGEKRWEGRLFGDVSAMTQINRAGPPLARVLERDDWHGRLLNGSDYPLPGVMPLFSLDRLASLGFLDAQAVPTLQVIREHNVLLFDFVTKRSLRWQGRRFATQVFETRPFFTSRPP